MSIYYTPSPISHSDSLLTGLFIAAVIHAIILMGLNFSIPQTNKVHKSIEISFSSTASRKAPKKAKYLAENNQIGGGNKNQKAEPPKQKIASNGASQKKQLKKKKSVAKPKAAQKRVTVKKAIDKVVTAEKIAPLATLKKPQLNAETLQKQIAQLGERIRQSQSGSELNKFKFVNQVSTHKYIASQYERYWVEKVTTIGRLNYPKAARKKGFTGTLTMDVGIKEDGSIYSMRITRSSGINALDDAAKRIVRLGAPYAPLPDKLLKEANPLGITRTWKFSDESGMTTR